MWKNTFKIKHDDFDALFEEYINTQECQHCAKPFISTRLRHLDHDHTTGLFRAIVCHKCNTMDSYIKYPEGYDVKEYKKQYYEKYRAVLRANMHEKGKEKRTCLCGSVVRYDGLAPHRRRKKHMDWVRLNSNV